MSALFAHDVPAVILAGGSEIVAISLAEELSAYGVPLIVISLGRQTLLRDALPSMKCAKLPWPPLDGVTAAAALVDILRKFGAGEKTRWPVFATEDGGLRLLMEASDVLNKFVVFGGAPGLSYGGLDKAAFFTALHDAGLGELGAPTMVLESLDDVDSARAQLGPELVIKPALKPFSMQLNGMRSKVLVFQAGARDEEVKARLEDVWHLAPRWVAQKRLRRSVDGEAVGWSLRTFSGGMRTLTAIERWKQPVDGGSGCWVQLRPEPAVVNLTETILAAINYRGVAEVPFLQDEQGRWRALEINPRPWLQIALPGRSGVPLAYAAYRDLIGDMLALDLVGKPRKSEAGWVNIERLLLAVASGEQGPRVHALRQAMKAWIEAECKIVYDTPLPSVQRRWVCRMAMTALQRMVS